MIIDNIKNFNLYKGAALKYCLDFLRDYKEQPEGRIELKDGIYILIQRYNSKQLLDGKLEAHKKYVDIQYIVSGSEVIGYCANGTRQATVPYNPDKDVMFFLPDIDGAKTNQPLAMLPLKAGDFAVFYPDDLHMPGIGDGTQVQKIVVKIPLELLTQ